MNVSKSTTLSERLKESIRRNGPITFHDWMNAALYDPSAGYYNRTDLKRWGREGDYRTSPERCELFAVTFARYFAYLFDQLHQPQQLTIVESGAGDGRFAAGVMRALQSRFPRVFEATRYFLDELSADARRRAREKVEAFGERVRFGSLSDLAPIDPGIFFSNEFFDAFPIHRLTSINGKLFEQYVSLAPAGEFIWSTGPLSDARLSDYCREYSLGEVDGQVFEVNLDLEAWLAQVAKRLKNGFVITVDYGAEADELYHPAARPNGTLRAFSRHNIVADILARPGDVDITASINWTHVKAVGARLGFTVTNFAQLDEFLLRGGILEELEERLKGATTDAERLVQRTAVREMILPGGMASSFQVLVQKVV